MRRNNYRFQAVDLLELVGFGIAVPVMPASLLYMRKKFWKVIEASV